MNKLELAEQIYLDQIAGPEMYETQLEEKARYAVKAAEIFYSAYVSIKGTGKVGQEMVGCKACFGSGGKKNSPCKVCNGAGKVVRPD
jgi:DnaJ-class molecular chaperone